MKRIHFCVLLLVLLSCEDTSEGPKWVTIEVGSPIKTRGGERPEAGTITCEGNASSETIAYARPKRKRKRKKAESEIVALDPVLPTEPVAVETPPINTEPPVAREPISISVPQFPTPSFPYSPIPASWLALGYTFGKGIETHHSYLSAELMLFAKGGLEPLTPFLIGRSYYLDNYRWAASAGLGTRWLIAPQCVGGANVFYDNLMGDLGTYQQVGVGLEYLSYCWEARINGYFPVHNKAHFKELCFFDDYIGGYFIQVNEREEVSRGFDAEIGYNFYFCNCYRLYTGLGPAWFQKVCSKENHWAFKARARLELSDYFSLEGRTYKSRGDWHWQGAVFLTIPLECAWELCCGCNPTDLFSRPIWRNAMIKTSRDCCFKTNF